ncbi:hypothetical protein JOE44_004122 [Chryseobacterium sp. PvR013]|uniref:hypothetical protein n=1 Tax=Chryseobacterium sp. PvR013 TaxID=2806595 RepID=UPI001AEB5B57|nr:hypothetical protein [Chryseobacterium sp. PvR013]MBP1167238.1 hypothetical protein [Chryseobacterium sp. PvR013]
MVFYTYSENIEHLKAFDKEYKLEIYYKPPTSYKNLKRKSVSDRICRFCGKDSNETSFKSKTHVISELFGKNSGISDHECDTCNNFFSTFEGDMANFLGLDRSINALGFQTPPTFLSGDKSIKAKRNVFKGFNGIEIRALKDGVIQKKEKGNIEFSVIENSYIPINIFKCLLKIALTVIPDDNISKYKLCLNFIMQNQNASHFAHHAKQIHRGLLGFSVSVPKILIFRKRNFESKLPTYWIKLYYQNSYIQFYLPYYEDDKILSIGEEISYPLCPPLIRAVKQPKGIAKNLEKLDLSSNEKTRSDLKKLNLKFDEDLLIGTDNTNNFNSDEIVSIFITKDSGLLDNLEID